MLVDGDNSSYGANGFHVDFLDPNNLGLDSSGNGNDFTATGFDTTRATQYQLETGNGTAVVDSQNAFIDDNSFATTATASAYLNFRPAPISAGPENYSIQYNSSLEIAVRANTTQARITNSTGTQQWQSITGSDSGRNWFTLTNNVNDVQFIQLQSSDYSTERPGLYNIRVDGTVLTKSTGTDYDLMADGPSQNWATGNPLMHGIDGGTRIMAYNNANLGFAGGVQARFPGHIPLFVCQWVFALCRVHITYGNYCHGWC